MTYYSYFRMEQCEVISKRSVDFDFNNVFAIIGI